MNQNRYNYKTIWKIIFLCVNISFFKLFECSECRTVKTSSQTVSIQVQPVRHLSRPWQDPHGYNSVNYQQPLPLGGIFIWDYFPFTFSNFSHHFNTSFRFPLCSGALSINFSILSSILALSFITRTPLLYTVIKVEFWFWLMYFGFICYKLNFLDVIIIPSWLSIAHDSRQSCYALYHS